MFDAFEVQPDVAAMRKRLVVAVIAASLTVSGLGAGTIAIAASRPASTEDKTSVDVSFRPPPPPPEPAKIEKPPPPPPKKVKPPPTPTPVVEAPPAVNVPAPAAAAAPMVAPKEVPKTAAPESDTAVAAINVAVGGQGDGSGTSVGKGNLQEADESSAPVAAATGSGPINLPEDAEPAEPDEDNEPPEYPEAARTTGQEAKVVLKIVVEKDGRVGRVQLIKGEEPFVTAAIAAVKKWKYSPATLDGVPLAHFKIVNVKFSLRE